MSEEEQNLLKRDIASFLRQMHGLDYTDISECTIDNKQTPSKEDIDVTHRLKESGKLIGIELLDHIIIGDGNYISLQEKGIV